VGAKKEKKEKKEKERYKTGKKWLKNGNKNALKANSSGEGSGALKCLSE
jgi:uncharacterized protein YjcR